MFKHLQWEEFASICIVPLLFTAVVFCYWCAKLMETKICTISRPVHILCDLCQELMTRKCRCMQILSLECEVSLCSPESSSVDYHNTGRAWTHNYRTLWPWWRRLSWLGRLCAYCSELQSVSSGWWLCSSCVSTCNCPLPIQTWQDKCRAQDP